MKLDKRIENERLIYTPFTANKPKLHEKGYFTDDMWKFASLKSCVYGELAKYDINLHRPYGCNKTNGEDSECYSFYIPESRLVKDEEKKYRPYTLMEFNEKFTMGQPIKFRIKGKVGCERYWIMIGYHYEQYDLGKQTVTYINIGTGGYTLQELFEEYEWQKHYTEDFQPFGVEVEE